MTVSVHLRERLSKTGGHMTKCAAPTHSMGDVFRADAKATDDYAVTGGWEGVDGTPPHCARWFSLRIDRLHAPAFFVKTNRQQTIAARELLAIALCVRLFVSGQLCAHRYHGLSGQLFCRIQAHDDKVCTVSGFTTTSNRLGRERRYVGFAMAQARLQKKRQTQ